jgi:hypothetical protein
MKYSSLNIQEYSHKACHRSEGGGKGHYGDNHCGHNPSYIQGFEPRSNLLTASFIGMSHSLPVSATRARLLRKEKKEDTISFTLLNIDLLISVLTSTETPPEFVSVVDMNYDPFGSFSYPPRLSTASAG